MSHCHDEHEGHDHSHGGGAHDHSDDITPALQSLLYEQIDFSAVTTLNDLPATQTLELAQTAEVQEHPVKRALFNTTRSLALLFEDNFGDGEEDVTELSYLAFKGQFMRLSKEPINFLYEAAANPGDHKSIVGTKQGMGSDIA